MLITKLVISEIKVWLFLWLVCQKHKSSGECFYIAPCVVRMVTFMWWVMQCYVCCVVYSIAVSTWNAALVSLIITKHNKILT